MNIIELNDYRKILQDPLFQKIQLLKELFQIPLLVKDLKNL